MHAFAQDTQATIPARLTLAQAEDLLLQRNLTVAAARYQVEASRAARLIAGYKPNPVLTVGAEQLTFYGPLHDIVGGAVARDLCFTGRPVDAHEALRMRLVSAVVPVADLPAETERFAAQIARAPRDVLLRTKAKAVRRSGVTAGGTLDL